MSRLLPRASRTAATGRELSGSGVAFLCASRIAFAITLAGCTRSGPPAAASAGSPTSAAIPESTASWQDDAEVLEEEPVAPPAPDALHCAADREQGTPWAALDTLLARSPIYASFVNGPLPRHFACPPHFELVQTRP